MSEGKTVLSDSEVNVSDNINPVGGSNFKPKYESDGDKKHESLSENEGENGVQGPRVLQKKHKHRRRKAGRNKRRWKPFHKLSWPERMLREDREAKRAERLREEKFQDGKPMAPFNTTQFVIEDHNVSEPNLTGITHSHYHRQRAVSGSLDEAEVSNSTEDVDNFYSSPSDEEEFLEKDFYEEYESVHVERLQNMSKDDLVKDYLQIQAKLESAQCGQTVPDWGTYEMEKRLNDINALRTEIRRLREENEKIRSENKRLKELCEQNKH